jgi:hypothetical protein
MLGADWQPGHQDSAYSNNTTRYSITAIDLVSKESNPQRSGMGDSINPYAYFDPKYRSQLFERRLIPGQVDISLLRGWVTMCQQNHPHVMSQAMLDLGNLGAAHFRVVNVLENKLVELKVFSRFVALSYVWGKCAQPNMFINKTGFIDVEHLPRTIKDAIHLTKLLGERYIWIDSICIDQNSPEEKHAVIGCMNRIYESACLTIVATGGTDANAGLPGLFPGSRTAETATYVSTKGSIIGLVLSRPSLLTLINRTRWNTRGWTYQEHVLSDCCLFFTETEVFYSCPFHGERKKSLQISAHKFHDQQVSEWREGYVLETREQLTNYQTSIEWGASSSRWVDPMVRPGAITAEESINLRLVQYTKAVPLYTLRQLSHQSDIVFALGGIIAKIWAGKNQPASLKHGLPMESLPTALLWEAGKPGRMTRRAIDGVSNRYTFPSWSWAGWVGPINYRFTFNKKLQDGWLYKPGTYIQSPLSAWLIVY